MIYKLFTIHDAKVAAYLQPFFLRSKGEAIRTITDALADPNHNFTKHPEDYYLFFLGEYDDATGILLPLPTPEPVMSLLDLVNRPELKPELVKDIHNG